MIHDLDSAWKALAAVCSLTINYDTNTNIIINDIFNWAMTFQQALLHMECQLCVCKAYRLTLSLKKSHFFPRDSSLLVVMFPPIEIAQPCQNTTSCAIGQSLNWFAMWPALLDFFNSIAISYLISRCACYLCAKLCHRSIRNPLVTCGHPR